MNSAEKNIFISGKNFTFNSNGNLFELNGVWRAPGPPKYITIKSPVTGATKTFKFIQDVSSKGWFYVEDSTESVLMMLIVKHNK